MTGHNTQKDQTSGDCKYLHINRHIFSVCVCVCVLTAVDLLKTRAVTGHNTQKNQTCGNCKCLYLFVCNRSQFLNTYNGLWSGRRFGNVML